MKWICRQYLLPVFILFSLTIYFVGRDYLIGFLFNSTVMGKGATIDFHQPRIKMIFSFAPLVSVHFLTSPYLLCLLLFWLDCIQIKRHEWRETAVGKERVILEENKNGDGLKYLRTEGKICCVLICDLVQLSLCESLFDWATSWRSFSAERARARESDRPTDRTSVYLSSCPCLCRSAQAYT